MPPHVDVGEANPRTNSLSSGVQITDIKAGIRPSRGGFNDSEFDDLDPDFPDIITPRPNSSGDASSITISDEELGFRERIYSVIDGSTFTAILAVILLIDYLLLLLQILLLLGQEGPAMDALDSLYKALDWITAFVFLTETNARLFCYGAFFYFNSALRSCEYLVSATNAVFVVMWHISSLPWLQITRFIRLMRIITIIVTWRERKLKWRTRQELEALAKLLEKEKSERTRLTKWRIQSDDIAIGEKAGHGGFGTVFSGLFRGTLVAVKQLSSFERDQSSISIEDEAITLVNLRHPNVVLFMGFVHEPSKLWIVTEYCSRGSLRDLLDDDRFPLTQGRALKLALGAAHFGLSRNIENTENCFSGTVQYAAPEVLESNSFSTAADIYSFGVCLWEIAAREVPFKEESPMSVLWGVVKSNLRPSMGQLFIRDFDHDSELGGNETDARTEAAATAAVDINQTHRDNENRNGQVDDFHRTESRQHHSQRNSVPFPKNQCFRNNAMFGQVQRCEELPRMDKKRSKSLQDGRRKTATFSRGDYTAMSETIRPVTRTNLRTQEFDPIETSKKKTTALSQSRCGGRSVFPKTDTLAPRAGQGNDRRTPGGQLDNLSRRVTATIHKFDDRPPIVRRKEGEDSGRSPREVISRGSDALASDAQPRLSSKTRSPFSNRNSPPRKSRACDFSRAHLCAARVRRTYAIVLGPEPKSTTQC
ncbi:unnamed protein product [Chondrus crispus]|uniref:Protein kinase domain-containing protein n=1 Tax=Chondrus crispus TaxID=2769 RepID=R7QGB6_CHOCR|nr:unnamed protein product [Chondrus crispus]CDF36823.1 unnamed protein product [Chondrus crispus]|eukprot:XP_005716642.1 unnamed protein product [Chondrus crispus]